MLQPAPTSTDRATSLIRGIRGQPGVAISCTGPGPRSGTSPRDDLNATPRTSREAPCNPGTSAPWWIQGNRRPLHETVRKWVRVDEVDNGARPGVTTVERERIKVLERENRELRRVNEILKAASSFFARELDPRLPR